MTELTEPPEDKLTREEVDDAVWMIAQLTKLLWRDGKPRALTTWVRMAVMDALDTLVNELEG